jgi:hypothetical protein
MLSALSTGYTKKAIYLALAFSSVDPPSLIVDRSDPLIVDRSDPLIVDRSDPLIVDRSDPLIGILLAQLAFLE